MLIGTDITGGQIQKYIKEKEDRLIPNFNWGGVLKKKKKPGISSYFLKKKVIDWNLFPFNKTKLLILMLQEKIQMFCYQS